LKGIEELEFDPQSYDERRLEIIHVRLNQIRVEYRKSKTLGELIRYFKQEAELIEEAMELYEKIRNKNETKR
jgi:hypothetical protein